MEEESLFQRLLELGYDLPEEFALFPPIIFDIVRVDWALEGGNDLLVHYMGGKRGR